MIVYFSGKRKVARVLALVGIGLAGLYGQFVYGELARDGVGTLQIVKNRVSEAPGPAGQATGPPEPVLPFVASKRGTYFYPVSCSRAKTLSVKNTLYFKDISEAEAAGYKPYSGC